MVRADSVAAVVLAAGKGTRMGSDRAKVLHALHGRPLVSYPIEAARAAGASAVVVVVGHQKQEVIACVREAFPASGDTIAFAEQAEQLGTGHAVACALPLLPSSGVGPVLILSGDVPGIRAASLATLLQRARDSAAGVAAATFFPDDPTGYGRMLRDDRGALRCIREHRDATEPERAVRECNAGIYAVMADVLRAELPQLGRANAQGEVYLTDLIALGAARGAVATVALSVREAAGINTVEQLAAMEAEPPPR